MRRILQYILSIFIVLPLMAEENGRLEITNLNWDELKIDSVLPVYTEVVPLQTDFSLYNYSVTIEYPEYAPLTQKETEEALKFDSLITERLNVESHVGVSRGEGMLDIAFVPIIRRGNSYLKLVSAQIVINSTPKRQLRRAPVDKQKRYADHSKLQQGRWVKISITTDGMYRLTRSALKNMGFSNPSKVHLYGYGGHLQNEVLFAGEEYDDMVEVPLYYSSKQDAWLFWGNGLISWNGDERVTNFYANAAYYFLTEEDGDATSIGTEPSFTGRQDTIYTNFTDHVLYEKDEYAWYHGGRSLFENTNYANINSHTYSLQTIDPEYEDSLTTLKVVFSASNKTPTKMTTSVNGTQMGTMSLAATEIYIYGTASTAVYDLSKLERTNNWTVRLTSTAGQNARLDYLSLTYKRKLKPNSGYVAFSQIQPVVADSILKKEGPGGSRFDIEGSGLKVMRIGCPGDPATLIEGTQNGSVYSVVVEDPTRQYVAFDESYEFPEPSNAGVIDNQDLHALDSLDMVIIIPNSGKLLDQATRLVEAHEKYDGLRCTIVYANQVYNEFSSGTPDATAYRRLMKMLYDKAETMDDAPKYLLLFGDAAWDNRMVSTQWRKYSPDDYLLCYPSENSFSDTRSFVMEDYFGLLDDGEGTNVLKDKPDLGVGRFPVTSSADAKVMVDKTITYLSRENAGEWKNLVYLLGDDGDENQHMRYADDVAEQVKATYPEMEVRKIMWDAYKIESTGSNLSYPTCTRDIKQAMKDGALIINYVGHAATYGMSHEFVLRVSDFAEPCGDKLALWVTAACDVMPFDGQVENIGETAVLNPKGGALAFYGTARTVYATQNLYMNRYFMRYLFGTDAKGRRYKVGDAIRLAKNALITGNMESSYRENKLQYALLGDPSLEFGEPTQKVILDSINGSSLKSSSSIPLKAGQRVRLTGHLADAKGDLKTDFTGTMAARMYDNEETITCHNNQGARVVFTYEDRTNIYTCQDSVVNGKFDLEFVIPVDINNSNEAGRFAFYALNNERNMEANGYNEKFLLGGMGEVATDTIGPRIQAGLNGVDFENGGVVNKTPYFVAKLEDESGINYSGNGIGHDLVLCVDNDVNLTYTLNNYFVQEFGDFTRGTVSYVLPELESGSHTLTFRAWDVLNNTNAVSLNFVVDPTVAPNMFNLTASQNPARTSTNFLISYDLVGTECDFTLEVFDFSGRRVWYHQEQGSSPSGLYTIPWNLCTNAGAKLFTGIYFYRCQMTCGNSKKVSKTQKIVILNNK
ncbi:MAG: type IX secretion system sortase PorU [Bacteroidaceae bacterium]|nr:type IX secretion system sortase PorU [Bacteroidaceae bacterium]